MSERYEHYHLKDGDVSVYSPFDFGPPPDALFRLLYDETPWEQRTITLYGREILQPRLIAWYGEHSYTYSGLRLEPRPWTAALDKLKNIMSDLCQTPFNGVLLNLYEDGQHSIGMHADDEPEFGYHPTIASISLGAERVIEFERKDKAVSQIAPVKIPLISGSVMVMKGATQEYWKHGIKKTKESVGPRINLTFRNIVYPR